MWQVGVTRSNTVINRLLGLQHRRQQLVGVREHASPNNVPGSGVSEGKFFEFGGGNPFLLQGRMRDAFMSPDTTGATVAYDPALELVGECGLDERGSLVPGWDERR